MSRRSSCKRSHDDLEDADECLPISKRINSLHIEGQPHCVNLQDPNGPHLSPVGGYHENGETSNSCLMGNHNHHDHINVSQAGATRRIDVNCEMTSAPRLPTINEQDYFEINQRQGAASMNPHFSNSMSDPYTAYPNPSVQNYATASSPSQSSLVSSFPSSESHQKLSSQMNQQGAYYSPDQHSSSFPMCSESSFSSHSLPLSSAVATENSQLHNHQLAMLHHTHGNQQLDQHNVPNGHSTSFPHLHHEQLSLFPNSPSEQQQQLASPSHFQGTMPSHPQQIPQSPYSHDFHTEQLPSGEYDPELGVAENPFYFSVNRMLYEAHLSRVRRDNSFHNHS